MRGLARLIGHESCMRVDENYKRLAVCTLQLQVQQNGRSVSERFSDMHSGKTRSKRCPSHYP